MNAAFMQFDPRAGTPAAGGTARHAGKAGTSIDKDR
jgi:hypothetical protein